MKIERRAFCRILFAFSADNRKGLEADAGSPAALRATETRRPASIPFMEIAGLSGVRKRLFRSAMEIPLMHGKKMVFGGVDPAGVGEFVQALNEAWEQA